MSDPVDTLRAAAPAVPPSRSRDTALRSALATPVPVAGLRRWWVASGAAVTGLLLVLAGTSAHAIGSGSEPPVEEPAVVAPSEQAYEIVLTRPDGTVYSVVEHDEIGR